MKLSIIAIILFIPGLIFSTGCAQNNQTIPTPNENSSAGTIEQNPDTETTEIDTPCSTTVTSSTVLTAENFDLCSVIKADPKEFVFTIKVAEREPLYRVHIGYAPTANPPTKLSVEQEGSKVLQNLKVSPELWAESWRTEHAPAAFVLRDINFDGYTDIGLTVDGGAKWGAEYYWVFNPKTKQFITNQLTTDLRKVNHNDITFETSTKHIITNNFIGAGIYKKTVYDIKNGRLITLEDYEQEPVYENDEPSDTCVQTTKKNVNGITKTVRTTTTEACSGYMEL